jgi:hypothetical protein
VVFHVVNENEMEDFQCRGTRRGALCHENHNGGALCHENHNGGALCHENHNGGALCHDGVLWRGPDFGSYLLLVESVMPLPLPDVTPLATHEL